MIEKCKHCPNWTQCQRHGCYAWNNAARKKIDDEAKQAKRQAAKFGVTQ